MVLMVWDAEKQLDSTSAKNVCLHVYVDQQLQEKCPLNLPQMGWQIVFLWIG